MSDSCVSMQLVTCTAPVNIAVIKYWGKRDENLILPINSSLSATLNQDELCTTTTVAASKQFNTDRIWLNGKEESIENPRLQSILKEIRKRTRKRKINVDDNLKESKIVDMATWGVHICSSNNFPTAAGLASSAAGYACLVYSLAKLYNIDTDISLLARLGSGSACRSVYGGYVEWQMGTKPDGTDSIAVQIAPESHWPEMRVIILVVSDHKKPIGSSPGMQITVKTSDLIDHRAKVCVPQRMTQITEAILNKDFKTFAEITMKDSNQFHAVCLDTHPPIFYLNDTSRQIIQMIHKYNSTAKETKVAYTFDAGPNACLYLLEKDVPEVLSLVNHCFPQCNSGDDQYIRGIPVDMPQLSKEMKTEFPNEFQTGALKYIIHTKVGPGPQVIRESTASLLGEDGLPKNLVN